MDFKPYWDYKRTNAVYVVSLGVYTSEKILKLYTIDKIHLKSNVIDGFVVNGKREPIIFSFVLDKSSGYKVFCEPGTIHYRKINISVLNTTFYLEKNNFEEVDFNGQTVTFTLQMIQI